MTRRPHLRQLGFVAAGLCLSAAAEAAPSACSGKKSMQDDKAGTIVIRSGSGHSSHIVQADPQGVMHIEQHGRDHATLAVQSGTGDHLVIRQSGSSAEADITQDGSCNASEISQSGSGNRATVRQSGSTNRAVIRQSGPGGRP
jgi:hypothetical protein